MPVEDERWVLPEGVEEVLPPDAACLEAMRRRVLDLFRVWGYELVIPPFIEYLDSLLTGTGSDLDLQTFKLIDQLTGRLMGVRADMTPQVARIDAHHLERDEPVRLCYLGTVLHTLPDGVSGSRSPIQVGAELYGHGGRESDCEVVCLMLDTLAAAGVRDVHLDLGHVGVYRALTRAAGLSERQEAALNDALQRKAQAELEALIGAFGLTPDYARMLRTLAELNGGHEVLARARETLAPAGEGVAAEVGALEALAALVRARAPDVPMHFDLAELRGYRYHTGVVFAAFVSGHGQEIARGGRYDEIGKDFGSTRPATGFSTDLKILAELCAGDGSGVPLGGILVPWSSDPELLARVRELRCAGERVVCELPGQPGVAGCDRALRHGEDGWELAPVAEARMPPSGAQRS